VPDSQVEFIAPPTPVAPAAPLNMGTASNFALLAEDYIQVYPFTTVSVLGHIGVLGLTSIYGFDPLTMDASGRFAISPMVSGRVYASSYSEPTPAMLQQAIL